MSSSLARAFDVLDLFTLETPRLTSEEVSARLGYSRSMAYRYLKELCDAGLLVPQSGGQYGLGPRIIELERLVALTDPLYLAGRAVLKGRSREDSAYLLQNLYEDKVLCIYKEGPDVLEHAGRRTVILARGQPFPLFQGSLAGAAGLPAASPDPPDLSAQRAGHRRGRAWRGLGRLPARAGGDPQGGLRHQPRADRAGAGRRGRAHSVA